MHNKIDNLSMRGRKAWTHKEDDVLRFLKEERGEIKWSAIAKIMQQQFAILGKTGKQCRERYHNHLMASISNCDWSELEDKDLLRLHEEFGNKWSIIAQQIPGRSQNCVKNHFYSKLRKVVRRLNHFNAGNCKSATSIIPPALLSKIISVSESRFKLGSKVSEEWVNYCMDLITRLYNFESNLQEEHSDSDEKYSDEQIIEDIAYFELNFKKKRITKNDSNEGDYRQRVSNYSKRKQAEKDIRARLLKKEKDAYAERSKVKVESECIPISPISRADNLEVKLESEGRDTFSGLTLQRNAPSNEQICLQNESEMVAELLQDNQNQLLKTATITFQSFCELDKQLEWRNVQILPLEQSQQYSFQYSEISGL